MMGVAKDLLPYMYQAMDLIGEPYINLNVLELGNQRMRKGASKDSTLKKHLSRVVYEHCSIDWNGKDKAIRYDLSKEIRIFALHFDVVTNFGTSEHVSSQEWCFRNIHNFCRQRGVMLHVVPLVGNWKGHCEYYYSEKFFESLAAANNYEVAFIRIHERPHKQSLVVALLRKKTVGKFVWPNP